MANCAKCGAKLEKDARFCGACGSKVNDKQEKEGAQKRTDSTLQEPDSARKKKKLIAILTGACSTAVVLALIFAVGIVYGKRAQPEELRQTIATR